MSSPNQVQSVADAANQVLMMLQAQQRSVIAAPALAPASVSNIYTPVVGAGPNSWSNNNMQLQQPVNASAVNQFFGAAQVVSQPVAAMPFLMQNNTQRQAVQTPVNYQTSPGVMLDSQLTSSASVCDPVQLLTALSHQLQQQLYKCNNTNALQQVQQSLQQHQQIVQATSNLSSTSTQNMVNQFMHHQPLLSSSAAMACPLQQDHQQKDQNRNNQQPNYPRSHQQAPLVIDQQASQKQDRSSELKNSQKSTSKSTAAVVPVTQKQTKLCVSPKSSNNNSSLRPREQKQEAKQEQKVQQQQQLVEVGAKKLQPLIPGAQAICLPESLLGKNARKMKCSPKSNKKQRTIPESSSESESTFSSTGSSSVNQGARQAPSSSSRPMSAKKPPLNAPSTIPADSANKSSSHSNNQQQNRHQGQHFHQQKAAQPGFILGKRNQQQRRTQAEETSRQQHQDMNWNAQKRLRVASVTENQNFSTSHSRFIPTIPLDQKVTSSKCHLL